MLKEKRHALILDLLQKEKLATITDLSQRLGASYMTIWRDLETLEQQGLLQRVRGGAVALKPEGVSGLPVLPFQSADWEQKNDPVYSKKVQIARYAAEELVDPGDHLIIEAGTTCSHMAPFLRKPNLTVLTNGLLASAMLFASLGSGTTENITVMCSGGILIGTGAFTGPQAEEFFTKFRVKKAFLSAQGVSLEDGFTDQTPLYTRLKSAMKQNSEKAILLLDSSKFGVRSLIKVMGLDEVDILVTDPDAPEEIVEGLRGRGIDVRIVQAP